MEFLSLRDRSNYKHFAGSAALAGVCGFRMLLVFLLLAGLSVTTNVGAATVWSASAWPVVGTRRSDRRCQRIATTGRHPLAVRVGSPSVAER